MKSIKTKSKNLSLSELEQAHRKSVADSAIAVDEAEKADRQEKAAWRKFYKLNSGESSAPFAISAADKTKANCAFRDAKKAQRLADKAWTKVQSVMRVANKNAFAFIKALRFY